MQEKANQDAAVIERTTRERDEARREAKACQADLGVEVTRRLDAEEVSAGLHTVGVLTPIPLRLGLGRPGSGVRSTRRRRAA